MVGDLELVPDLIEHWAGDTQEGDMCTHTTGSLETPVHLNACLQEETHANRDTMQTTDWEQGSNSQLWRYEPPSHPKTEPNAKFLKHYKGT